MPHSAEPIAVERQAKAGLPSGAWLKWATHLGRRASAAVRTSARVSADRMVIALAAAHRRRLRDTTFIGVTGSAGKTMTKLLTARVLATHYTGRSTSGTRNNLRSAARSLLQHARKGDGFHVVELSADAAGGLARQIQLVRPTIGVVTSIGTDHYSVFGSIEGIAAEKSKLIRALPPSGIAVLNADDERVLAMAGTHAGRVITYGRSAGAGVRATDVSSAWPERLSFVVTCGDERAFVTTKLVGPQWTSAVLAAIAVGTAFGVPLADAARAVADVEPNPGRMSPLDLPGGITVIRDDWKASVHTIPPALECLATARATRKVAVIGTISDTWGTASTVYANIAKQALASADLVCFVGPQAFMAMRAQPEDRPDRLRAFGTVRAATRFLDGWLSPGDLVLLKGSNIADHLYRIVLSRLQTVTCWRMDCKRQTVCNTCELVDRPVAPLGREPDGAPERDSDATPAATQPVAPAGPIPLLVVGLGNPEPQYRETPHNLGHRVVERLAERVGAAWRPVPEAQVAAFEWHGLSVWLVKILKPINLSGGALHRLADDAGVSALDCILVFDDMDLPVGTVRTRLRGTDGGHRGVRSVLEAFQTDRVRRVKVGARRPEDRGSLRDTVLAPFTSAEQPLVEQAVDVAATHVEALVKQGRPETAAPVQAAAVGGSESSTDAAMARQFR